MIVIASIVDVAAQVGYPVLFLLIAAESAGVPLPGETALITAGVLAGEGRLHIAAVIAIAAGAAIVGDNAGYAIARRGGRRLLEAPGPLRRRRREVLQIGEPFFERHGPKAVFLGRWILGLRTWASWLAGAMHMEWRRFLFWNALGGISWATTIGLLAYELGPRAKGSLELLGLYGLLVVAIALVSLLLARRLRRRRKPLES